MTWNITETPTISKREYFALQVLNGMYSGGRIPTNNDLRAEEFYMGFSPTLVESVTHAFKVADCMLAFLANEEEYNAVFDNPNEPKGE